MTGNDPTDQTLAVIASIFEKPAPKLDAKADGEKGDDASADPAQQQTAAEDGAMHTDAAPDLIGTDDTPHEDTPSNDAPRDDADDDVAAGEPAQHDAMDRALALAEEGVSVRIETMEVVEITMTSAPDEPEPAGVAIDQGPEDLDALTRHGPGPLEALRFKWSVRREDDGYYVDETIGTTSQPIVAGPLSRAEAISFIDTRERRTRRRYERLRNDIVSGPSERGVEDDDSDL
ncbi:hypothetical protein ACTZWT_05765 [Rhodopseudomonas sp. NSM]|uniref:hypothetical protein n=1 Tax=Rhodopseudomonas sp. NSM TaxID=3457630 RepID=UPI0040366618